MAPKKISQSLAGRYTKEEENALYIALEFYNSHRDVRATKIQKLKDGRSCSITTVGVSIRRAALMHQVPFSRLQRAVASRGMSAVKSQSQVHEGQMLLCISEEPALQEWCFHMHRWGYPIRLDLLGGMAAAIVTCIQRGFPSE